MAIGTLLGLGGSVLKKYGPKLAGKAIRYGTKMIGKQDIADKIGSVAKSIGDATGWRVVSDFGKGASGRKMKREKDWYDIDDDGSPCLKQASSRLPNGEIMSAALRRHKSIYE